ncbi:GTPase [Paenarthrobacter ilicis]|uniref:GTP-binding protein EngB required for normal cell division n=1 Tax=Paenarthrobacter ilicis TaxID=43665 RepID=A0ABX0TB68_9MICC|nr:GTPase [Paenarthrobacter ilicis]MBM7793578.1 GTP-binding protein EngB required for normal cell division [Paenarthrobacter ilicis]NII99758.1 GTP-binding protein EngB required for normal cell division [Paenarthrobacter ilicis]
MSRHSQVRESSQLQRRLESLNSARELAEGVLPDEDLLNVYDVLERAASRRSLSAGHTVIGFFGATGSGKSSLFNAVSGSELATTAARRPTTSAPLAGIWGEPGSGPLLDWLGVLERHNLPAVPGLADDDSGLVLLDLPDFDSTRAENREIVQRLVGMVDVLVWVMDPQKYADAAVHNDFLEPLASHGAVTLVVLNQVDRLTADDAAGVLESLKGILAQDGLGKVPVFSASAVTGDGVTEVRGAIRKVVIQREAATQRLAADVAAAADRLSAVSGEGEARGIKAGSTSRLAGELATAANVPVVVDAVQRSFARESARRTGWPVTRWLLRFRPDPLRRLNLGRSDAKPDVNRTSLPPAGAPERARTDAAVREFADEASLGAPGPWRAAIRAAAREGREQLPDALDQAIANVDLKTTRRPLWWFLFNTVQWLALLLAVGGLLWLGVLAALGYFQLPVPEVPRTEGWPWPTLMVAGGVLLGILLAMTGRVLGGWAARAKASAASRRLKSAVAEVARERIVEPVEVEIARLKAFTAALKAARQR